MSARRRVAMIAVLFGLLTGQTVAQGPAVIRIRTTEDLASCLERVLSELRPATSFVVEVGDPTVTQGADLVVGPGPRLTRVLESGRADDRWTARLGFHGRQLSAGSVVAAVVGGSARYEEARGLVMVLDGAVARTAFARCAGASASARDSFGVAETAPAFVAGSARYATAVVDWWMPACSLQRNAYTDRNEILGAPDALNQAPRGEPTKYRGMISLGQGGHVIVDMGQVISNSSGNDLRVYQFTGEEPVSLYAATSPSGPYTLVGFRRYCGNRIPGSPGNWGFCDFDLAEGGMGSARYLRVEDGELYPCLRGDTDSEGADIDAVELLNP